MKELSFGELWAWTGGREGALESDAVILDALRAERLPVVAGQKQHGGISGSAVKCEGSKWVTLLFPVATSSCPPG